MATSIEGFDSIRYQTRVEYTSGKVAQDYSLYISTLQAIFERSDVSPTDFSNVIANLGYLSELAENGRVENGTTYYLTRAMGTDLEMIARSLKAVGITKDMVIPDDLEERINLLQNWKSLAGFGVAEIFQSALHVSATAPRTLQSMVELDYVKEGNDLISQALANLEKTLQMTQEVLDVLAIIQSIANQIAPNKKPAFNIQDPSLWNQPDIEKFNQAYEAAAKAHFQQILATAQTNSTSAFQLIQAKLDLMSQLPLLEQSLAGNEEPITRSTVNSLPFFMYKIASDISAQFKTRFAASGVILTHTITKADVSANLAIAKSAVARWVIDDQDKLITTEAGANAGTIQNNITQGIKTAESLNDVKKAEVNRYMFLFEQFYKSSSSVLQKVTQIVERMAQGISR